MSYLVVQPFAWPRDVDGPDTPAVRREAAAMTRQLAPGECLVFGRGSAGVAVDVELSDPSVSRLAGEIMAVGDHWTLTNLSRANSYVVDNIEGGGEYIRVAPGRRAAPIPFELARIVIPTAAGAVNITVFAPAHGFVDLGVEGAETDSPCDATRDAFSLDQTSRYFQVLVALCESRLRDCASVAIPSTTHVARRLSGDGRRPVLTPAAIGYHIEYLARHKLRTQPVGSGGPSGDDRSTTKRETLVAVALRFGLVRPEHLALLPLRRPTTRSPQAVRMPPPAGPAPAVSPMAAAVPRGPR